MEQEKNERQLSPEPETMILCLDREILEVKSEDFTPEELEDKDYLSSLIEKMMNTMVANRAIGLAAIQVGLPKNLFVTCDMKIPVAINAKISYMSSFKSRKPEGCLSLGPDKFVKKVRNDFIRLDYIDIALMERKDISFRGFLARIIQHEMDHIDGKLI